MASNTELTEMYAEIKHSDAKYYLGSKEDPEVIDLESERQKGSSTKARVPH